MSADDSNTDIIMMQVWDTYIMRHLVPSNEVKAW